MSLTGPVFFAAQKIAQEYAVRRELKRMDEVGADVSARPGFFVFNEGRIRVGRNVSFGAGVEISCYKGGSIDIGDDVFIASHCVIASERGRVTIGSDCLVGEGVSIRATNHGVAAGSLMRAQPNVVQDISIGRDVWLGKGVAVLAGTTIADGCVIGANAVARESTEPNGIYAGVPIRKIGERTAPK